MRVVVAGWAGSTNLGDELVLAGMLRQLSALSMSPVVVSVDPAGTSAVHGVPAVPVAGLTGALRSADALVLGGGGLLQDETSGYNLPYHLSRVWAARALRRPVVGVGLGAGRLDTRLGRTLVRTLGSVPLAVRDAPSADLLGSLGLRRPLVAADLALGLPALEESPADVLAVCLRPWSAARSSLVPASLRARSGNAQPRPLVDGWARALDRVSSATGLRVRFVALQADRDGPLHEEVTAAMTEPSERVAPDLAGLLPALAAARAVVSMRYHGGVGAVLAGRPAVLVGYSPKVEALAGELGGGAALLPWAADGPGDLLGPLQRVLDRAADVEEARERLAERVLLNRRVLERLAR